MNQKAGETQGMLARFAGVYVHRRSVSFPRGQVELQGVYELRVDGTGRFYLRLENGPPIVVLERRDDHLRWSAVEGHITIVSPLGTIEARVVDGDLLEFDLPDRVVTYHRE